MLHAKTKVRTVVRRQINKDGPVIVTSPAFRFINTGTVTAYVNGFPLVPYASMGDDSAPFVAAMLSQNPNFKFYRDDTFDIAFKYGAGSEQTNFGAGAQQKQSATERQSVYLVETFYDVLK